MEIFMKFVWAFVIGGAVCTIGQILILRTNWTPSRILVAFVTVGVILEAVGLFKAIKEFAGAGITTPIVGFGGVLAKGVIDAVKKDGVLGILTGGVTAAAAGIATAVTFALIVSFFARSRTKV